MFQIRACDLKFDGIHPIRPCLYYHLGQCSGPCAGLVSKEEYREQARRAGNVTLTGFVPPARVPEYLAAADILVMPTTPDLAYAAFTSPLKLFEYMASGRPVVASDIPVIREVLEPGVNALLYPPRDADALATAALRLVHEPGLSAVLAEQAWADVQQYGWQRRAQRILDRITELAPEISVRSAGT